MEEIRDIKSVYPAFGELINNYFSERSVAVIWDALETADRQLDGMTRFDGSPLIGHSVNTATIVISEIGLGRNSTVSTLLHDVVRMGKMTPERAGELFGSECTVILKALCNISGVTINTEGRDDQTDNFRDLIVSYSTDPRVILIKLADRLEVMRELAMFPARKRLQKSRESLRLYAQIAHKLGLYSLKSELEDLSLRWIEPDGYKLVSRRLEESATERTEFISRFLAPVEDRLREMGIKYSIKSRTKSIFSIWNKMKRTGLPFEEIFDIFALRIVIDCPREQEKQLSWAVYSVVTDFYTPNPDRLRDWISIPKSNGYESLHTTVVDKEGHWVEIQIRSERMDAVAERGIAAHWRYKGVHQGGMGSEQWLVKLRELMEQDDPTQVQKLGKETTTGEIFVFTPKGDLKKLPEGATLLDFAFEIHTNLGATCTGGRINHRNASIREVLRNGDIVEINTTKNQKPKADWLSFVRTNRARNKIRAYLREEQAKTANLGREELERKIKNWKLHIGMEEAVSALGKYYKLKTGTEVYHAIGQEKIDIADTKDVLTRYLAGETFTETKTRKEPAVKPAGAAQGDALIIDDSIKGLDYKLARCCNPIRGDEVFGFVTVNSGITIHRTTCPNARRLREQYPYRVLEAKWRRTKTEGAFQATILLTTDNVTGIINKVTELITRKMSINIRSMNIAPNSKGDLTGVINIEVNSTRIVDAVVHSILKIKGVQRAHRVNS